MRTTHRPLFILIAGAPRALQAGGTPAWASRQKTLQPSPVRTRRLAPRAAGRGGPKLGLPAYRAGHSTRWATNVVTVLRPGPQPARRPSGPFAYRSARRSDRDPRSGGTTRRI